MRRTFSKSSKQKITAMGLAVMMTAQSPAMAAEIETSQTENTVVTQEATQEDSQEEATVAEDVSAAEQETVTEQETVQEEMAEETQLAESELESQSEAQEQTQVQESQSEIAETEALTVESMTKETETEKQTEEQIETESAQVQETGTQEVTEEVTTSTEMAEVESEKVTEESATEEESSETEMETENVVDEYALAENQQVLTDGWHQDENGNYTYVENGQKVVSRVIKIDGSWYSFDSSGKMITQGKNVNPDGSLRINTWVFDGSDWYYYGANGQQYQSGIYEIAGAQYSFEYGRLQVSTLVKDGDNCYVADANGCLTKTSQNGWILIGGYYYYLENGELVTSTVKEIGSAYYAFDRSGRMYANGEFLIDHVGSKMRARADGSLYVSQWYQDQIGKWYYYDQNAKGVSGKFEVNGTVYLFDNANMLKINGTVSDGDHEYLADQNGIWVQTPGWAKNKGNWYYIREDGSLYTGMLEIGRQRYYMNPVMLTNIDLKEVDGIAYTIDSNGIMTVASDGFHRTGMAKDKLFYISDGKFAGEGWKQIGGKWYYFEFAYTGDLYSAVCGSYVYIDGKKYLFNEDGTLATEKWYYDTRYDPGQCWYYALASGELTTGDTWIDGKLYHFDKNGRLKTGIIVEDLICKLYGEDGSLLESGTGQGWNLLGGQYYYLKGESLLKNGAYKLPDGKWYYFDSTGVMQTNTLSDRLYTETGVAQIGWILLDGKWYYASPETGKLYKKGFYTINGVRYYFDETGAMQTNDVLVNNNLITINESGAVTGTKSMEDGWNCYAGQWYYYQNGRPYTGWVGAYYIKNGEMLSNTVANGYYVGKDGAYVTNSWCFENRFYAKADGRLACGEWLEIDGKWYYFNDAYENVKFRGDGTYNDILETGIYTKEGAYISPKDYAQGWVLIDGSYYYKEGEDFIIDQAREINGDWYLFDAHGKMVTGFSTQEFDMNRWSLYEYDGGKFYYGPDGRRCHYIGWQVIDGKWCYFNLNSEAVTGWQIINGVKYYFGPGDQSSDDDHFMYTGYRVINGSLYYFDANGACQGVDRTFTGWHQEDGDWYYIKNGKAVTGKTVIGGTLYRFDSEGVWISD